jgi:hypothetical protein
VAVEPVSSIYRSRLIPPAVEAIRTKHEAGFSVADLCRRWKVGPDKIHGFLRRGELIGVNLASSVSAKPQWRITPESVEEFEKRRSSRPLPKPARRRRPQVAIDFFP